MHQQNKIDTQIFTKCFQSEIYFNKSNKHLKDIVKQKQLKFKQKYNILQSERTKYNTESSQFCQNSTVSIPKIVKQKHQQQQKFRKSMNNYKFHITQKNRKEKQFNIVKKKYSKIMQIRQNHLCQQMQLTKSKLFIQQQHRKELEKSRMTVRQQKGNVSKALEKSMIIKVNRVVQMKQIFEKNKRFLTQYKKQDVEMRHKLYQSQKSRQKLKTRKLTELYERRKSTGLQNKFKRILKQINECDVLSQQHQKFKQKVYPKIKSMAQITASLDKKIKQYRYILKEYPSDSQTKSLSFSTQI